MGVYYNEIDPFAAAWLRELMNENLIARGDVDERDIWDVTPADVAGYKQCHFFAGIGVWSLAARLAGIPDNFPLWTGSCSCQPFSAAGKRKGFADERHVWPAFFHLIDAERPERVVGEQVASVDGLVWLDLVQTDMENKDYAFGAVDTCAAGFGSPHIRQRLYWLADAHERQRGRIADRKRCDSDGPAPGRVESDGEFEPSRELVGMADAQHAQRRAECEIVGETHGRDGLGGRRDVGRLADTDGWNAGSERQQRGREQRLQQEDCCAGGMAESDSERRDGLYALLRGRRSHEDRFETAGSGEVSGRPGPTNGLWANPDWLLCRDQKWRPVEPGTFPLADAGTVRNRIPALRGAGNAVNVAQAAAFLRAAFAP